MKDKEKPSTPESRALVSKITNLKKLKDSPGWESLKQTMESEILRAAFALAENAPITPDQYNFQRGAMWAAKRLLDLPERLIQIYESEATLINAQEDLKQKETSQ